MGRKEIIEDLETISEARKQKMVVNETRFLKRLPESTMDVIKLMDQLMGTMGGIGFHLQEGNDRNDPAIEEAVNTIRKAMKVLSVYTFCLNLRERGVL